MKVRKIPVEVEAMYVSRSSFMDVYRWVERSTLGTFEPLSRMEGKEPWPESGVAMDPDGGLMIISTLEVGMWVKLGDWVIRGVKGEFYPCKPEIFEKTYEMVSNESSIEVDVAEKVARQALESLEPYSVVELLEDLDIELYAEGVSRILDLAQGAEVTIHERQHS